MGPLPLPGPGCPRGPGHGREKAPEPGDRHVRDRPRSARARRPAAQGPGQAAPAAPKKTPAAAAASSRKAGLTQRHRAPHQGRRRLRSDDTAAPARRPSRSTPRRRRLGDVDKNNSRISDRPQEPRHQRTLLRSHWAPRRASGSFKINKKQADASAAKGTHDKRRRRQQEEACFRRQESPADPPPRSPPAAAAKKTTREKAPLKKSPKKPAPKKTKAPAKKPAPAKGALPAAKAPPRDQEDQGRCQEPGLQA
uniref:Uncharacterized protein n=1 Tax=Sphaerodactylus townsendi TaxID=933632 RepID=A0ACB8EVR3_9SAUR